MRKRAGVLILSAIASTAAAVGHLGAQGDDVLVSFERGIGVHPVMNVAAPANDPNNVTFQNVRANLVKGVVPALGPWRIDDLRATVDVSGRIRVRGRGLLLAGGDNIGRNGNLSVFATLICEAAAPFVQRSSAATADGVVFTGVVRLEPNGDFRIDDTLKTQGGVGDPVPSTCPSPTLLIRAANGLWLAAGIPQFDEIDQ